MLASDSPTYLLRISGPLTTLGSLALSILPICRAISVFPQPGGPYRRMPFTCLQPERRENELREDGDSHGELGEALLQGAGRDGPELCSVSLAEKFKHRLGQGHPSDVPRKNNLQNNSSALHPSATPSCNSWSGTHSTRDPLGNGGVTEFSPKGGPRDAAHPQVDRGCRYSLFTPCTASKADTGQTHPSDSRKRKRGISCGNTKLFTPVLGFGESYIIHPVLAARS